MNQFCITLSALPLLFVHVSPFAWCVNNLQHLKLMPDFKCWLYYYSVWVYSETSEWTLPCLSSVREPLTSLLCVSVVLALYPQINSQQNWIPVIGTVEMVYFATIAFKLFVPIFKGICIQIIAMLTVRKLDNLITVGKQFLQLGFTWSYLVANLPLKLGRWFAVQYRIKFWKHTFQENKVDWIEPAWPKEDQPNSKKCFSQPVCSQHCSVH